MVKLMNLLFLSGFICLITLTCSFRSSFFRFSPQRQGFRAPIGEQKGNPFAHRWGKTVASGLPNSIALFTQNNIVPGAVSARKTRQTRRLWMDDEVKRLRELVKEYEAKVPPITKTRMWREIGTKMDRSSQSCKMRYRKLIKRRLTNHNKNSRMWTESQTVALREQFKLFRERDHPRMIQPPAIKDVWTEIGRNLNRSALSCQKKYGRLKRGAKGNDTHLYIVHPYNMAIDMGFTPEQDALIRQRVKDWGGKGWNKALYTKISEELGGVPVSIVRKRFYELKSQHKNPVVRFRYTRPSIKQKWNATLDARLSEAVRELGDSNRWQEVAERMNCSVTWSACRHRWSQHVKMVANYPNTFLPWTEQEFARLGQLVSERSGAVNSTSTKARTSAWTAIGDKLGRLPVQCGRKWRVGHFHKTGRYTPEEDALILQRVEEWGDKGVGLWQVLDKELNRANVRARWLALKTRPRKQLIWTEDMNDALLALVRVVPARKGRWIIVAERMEEQGWRITPAQCGRRYHLLQVGTNPVLTPQMIGELMSLRKKGASWKEIGEELDVSQHWCYKQWACERDKLLRHGPFTPEEDARIRKEVDGRSLKDLPRGFWSSLREILGRPADDLRGRWVITLHFKDA